MGCKITREIGEENRYGIHNRTSGHPLGQTGCVE